MQAIWLFLRLVVLFAVLTVGALFLVELMPVGDGFVGAPPEPVADEAKAHAGGIRIDLNPEHRRYVVAFNDIGPVPYKEPATMVASIGSKSAREAGNAAGRGDGRVKTDTAEFTGYVRAHLTGPSGYVTIDGDGSSVKYVGPESNATWSWQVTPKTLRPTRVTLQFFNLVRRDGELIELTGPTYIATVKVIPTWSGRARDAAEEYQFVLNVVVPIFSGFFGFLFGQFWECRKRVPPTAPEKQKLEEHS